MNSLTPTYLFVFGRWEARMKMNGNWKGAGNAYRIKCNNANNESKI